MSRRYFIGFLLEGDAADWHRKVTQTISDTFHTWKIHEKVPPHVTVFQPFETEHVAPLKKLLEEIVSTPVPGKLTLSGFDRFDEKVVFVDVTVEPDVRLFVDRLKGKVKNLLQVEEKFSVWHPHATIAYRLDSAEIRSIWEYVQTLDYPTFVLLFNNITLFIHDGDAWSIEQSFRFKS